MEAYKVKSLYNGTLADPEDRKILVTDQGCIVSVYPWEAEDHLKEVGVRIHDYSDYFLMPGLVDGHVHITLPGDGTAAEDFYGSSTREEILLTAAHNAEIALQSGITSLRDCGSKPDIVFALRDAVEKGIVKGPNMVLCGSSLTTTAGHTHFFEGEVDTPEQTVAKIRELHKRGADYVKLIATGGGTRNVIQYAQMLSDAQIKAACEEAHRLGTYATAHVCTTATAWSAVKNGVDMMEHLIFADNGNHLQMDEKLVDTIAEKNIPVCITMSVLSVSIEAYNGLGRPLTASEQAEYDMLCRFRDTIFEGFRRTCHVITYIPGTDAGWRKSAFDSLLYCMLPMVELGYTNLQVLNASTGLAAKLIGIGEKTGTIEPGKQADFILVKESPLHDIKNLRHIKAVYKNGQLAKEVVM